MTSNIVQRIMDHAVQGPHPLPKIAEDRDDEMSAADYVLASRAYALAHLIDTIEAEHGEHVALVLLRRELEQRGG